MTLNELIASQNYARGHGSATDAYGFGLGLTGAPAGAGGSPGGAPGGLPGATPGSYNPASGGIPGVTPAGDSLKNLIDAITANTGPLGNLISTLTNASAKALKDQYSPEYFAGLNTATTNTNKRLGGDITDLLPELDQDAAERAAATGQTGGQQYQSKLLRDMGLTRLKVERDALDDLGKIKGSTPTVNPFDIKSLVPDINLQALLQQLADLYKAAPVPEDVYKRKLGDILKGLGAGRGAGYGGGSPGYGGGARGTGGGTGTASSSIPANILANYGSRVGVNQPTAPPGPGWGETWNDEGGYANTGNAPATAPGAGTPGWDGGFDYLNTNAGLPGGLGGFGGAPDNSPPPPAPFLGGPAYPGLFGGPMYDDGDWFDEEDY